MAKDYFKDAQTTRDRLNEISPSMCMAKWLQVSMHLPQGLTQSCYHPPTHKVPLKELEFTPRALHNTHEKVRQRKLMWEGKRPEGCQYCWNIEDAPNGPHLSDRHYRSSEDWIGEDGWNEVVSGTWDENINPRYVEVNFNQACNFKCIYCSPHLSTAWEQEIKEYGPIQLADHTTHNNIDSLTKSGLMPLQMPNKDNPYVKAFWKWWPELYTDLKVFRMTGGEPLMDKNTFKVLDYATSHPHEDLEISMTSNLCPPQQSLFDKFIKKIKDLESPISKDLYDKWKKKGLIREMKYYAKAQEGQHWESWPRSVIIYPDQEDYADISPELPRVSRLSLSHNNFNSQGLDETTGDFIYSMVWFNSGHGRGWECIGTLDSEDVNGSNGIFLNIPRIKNFMLFASVDTVGDHAEYIRNGMDWERFRRNVHTYLSSTSNTEITFINTFNILSIPKLKEFLQFILRLRQTFGYDNQVLDSEIDADTSGKVVVKKRRQRVWFDIPYLRSPKWLSAQNAIFYPELMAELNECLEFMKENVEDENYSRSYVGFKKYEIAKLARDIAWISTGKETITDWNMRKKNFWKFIHQLDERRNTNFVETFPTLQNLWNDSYNAANQGDNNGS